MKNPMDYGQETSFIDLLLRVGLWGGLGCIAGLRGSGLTKYALLSSTCGTYPLSRRLAILHGYALRILHFSFCTAFHTICLHRLTLRFCYNAKLAFPKILMP